MAWNEELLIKSLFICTLLNRASRKKFPKNCHSRKLLLNEAEIVSTDLKAFQWFFNSIEDLTIIEIHKIIFNLNLSGQSVREPIFWAYLTEIYVNGRWNFQTLKMIFFSRLLVGSNLDENNKKF
jgi:hypothetical protein